MARENAELSDAVSAAKAHALEAEEARRRASAAAAASARRFEENEGAKATAVAELEAAEDARGEAIRELAESRRGAEALTEELSATRGMLKVRQVEVLLERVTGKHWGSMEGMGAWTNLRECLEKPGNLF